MQRSSTPWCRGCCAASSPLQCPSPARTLCRSCLSKCRRATRSGSQWRCVRASGTSMSQRTATTCWRRLSSSCPLQQCNLWCRSLWATLAKWHATSTDAESWSASSSTAPIKARWLPSSMRSLRMQSHFAATPLATLWSSTCLSTDQMSAVAPSLLRFSTSFQLWLCIALPATSCNNCSTMARQRCSRKSCRPLCMAMANRRPWRQWREAAMAASWWNSWPIWSSSTTKCEMSSFAVRHSSRLPISSLHAE
mmetsp:Transcript_75689/g.179846  ORF Transcript_75689/g.179846 Transcript_75689/m.179846 type:complete len:251 (+) Transcript_75689:786-1538(+)